MAITLALGGTVLTLPPDLIWTDEYKRSPVVSTKEWSTVGVLLWDTQAKQSGLPVTLEGGERHAWMTRAECDAVKALLAIPGAVLTLTLHDDRVLEVMFDTSEDEPFSATQVVDYSDPIPTDWYVPTLRFIEV
ncbi:hypothetical protein FVQ98_14040 [Ottowia sp. GY511]|uniref:Uncharacterized protein n=1 Tax=Ottowia flava TaxID=2675430 RepID=A0ABW4KPR0_9BURK|nr:hypothetical protein [Ottowia sp. GY511]TXK26493.1 hypothetical protein FVQ98_14040 [Ottowia sp. GY511]